MLTMFRIGVSYWLAEDQFEHLLAFLGDYIDTVDELAFFTSATHAPLSLETMRPRLARLGDVMARTRQVLGVRAGINVLATIGHHEENLGGSLDASWQRVVDPEGRECRGCFCPNDPAHQRYVQALYTMVAEAGPDFVWVDDDVRLAGHKPVTLTCFCDYCLAQLVQETGMSLSRQELLARFDGVPDEAAMQWRRLWLAHNRATIAKLLATAEQAVHAVAPGLPLGFMTGDRFYEGYGFADWAEALEGPRGSEVRWRPGGGFYWDDSPLGLVDKAHDIGRQVAALPRSVTVIQSEIENFPYHRLKKSVRATMVEAAAHMAASATGIAFNVLSQQVEPLGEYRPFLAAAGSARPFFAAMREHLGRSPALGVWPAWNQDLYVANGWPDPWFGEPSVAAVLKRQYVVGEVGIPVCYSKEGACMATLSGASPLACDREELIEMLQGGVLLDVGAWQALDRLGLAHLTGVRPCERVDHDASERLLPHPLNGDMAGRQRDCRQSFWFEPVYRLEPTGDGVTMLATLVDYLDRDLGPCMSVFENELGGRVVVAGYYPWFLLHNEAKSTQVKALCSWLSRDTLPVVVESFAKVVAWARGEPGQPPAIVLLNASMDAIPELSIRVHAGSDAYESISLGGNAAVMQARQCPGLTDGYRRIVLPDIDPWSMHLLRPV